MTEVAAAVDGSRAAEQAADWAAREAELRGATLRLVHASSWERYEAAADHDVDDPFLRAHEAARRLLDEQARRIGAAHPGLTVATGILPEETVPALLEAGRESGLLVLGTRGLGALKGLMLGSVCRRVAGRAPVPVVIVPEGSSGSARGRVVLGLGAHQPPGAAAEFAATEAALRGAELELVHAWDPDPQVVGLSVVADPAAAQQRAQVLLAAVECGVDLEHVAPDVKVRGQAVPGPAAEALVQAGAEADLLVLGVRRRHGGPGRVAHAVLHRAPCPVAVVPLTEGRG
ncbi:universal stress protein [Streptacidiphilus monticola]|uniref:Universal stress protein n=1 Tax=Streptacidiphilus monticola TaxID=2161674 RepID=A0ABW1FV33_9ACTN